MEYVDKMGLQDNKNDQIEVESVANSPQQSEYS